MNRGRFIAAILAAGCIQVATALPTFAATFVEKVVSQLRAQGFESIEVESTWLGRARIEAEGAKGSREIVLDPNTGEILRDLWLSGSDDGKAAGRIGDDSDDVSDDSSDDSSDDNDDDDKDGDGDNSGHGGGGDGDNDNDNSGSGSGGDDND